MWCRGRWFSSVHCLMCVSEWRWRQQPLLCAVCVKMMVMTAVVECVKRKSMTTSVFVLCCDYSNDSRCDVVYVCQDYINDNISGVVCVSGWLWWRRVFRAPLLSCWSRMSITTFPTVSYLSLCCLVSSPEMTNYASFPLRSSSEMANNS